MLDINNFVRFVDIEYQKILNMLSTSEDAGFRSFSRKYSRNFIKSSWKVKQMN